MTGETFFNLSSKEKKKIMKTVIRGANKDQKSLVDKYKKLQTTKK